MPNLALEGYEGEGFEEICEDTTRWSHYYILGSLARGSLGIPRAEDVARPAFYCATVDYVTAIAALDHPLRDLECPSLQANSRLLQKLAEAHQQLLDIGCRERDQHLENGDPSSGLREEPSLRPPPALTRLSDLHSLGVKLYTNPKGLLSQACGLRTLCLRSMPSQGGKIRCLSRSGVSRVRTSSVSRHQPKPWQRHQMSGGVLVRRSLTWADITCSAVPNMRKLLG